MMTPPADAVNSSEHDGYRSPLVDRYASKAMQGIWSARRKFETWRKIWLAVAEAQHEMGLPVMREQVEELRANLDVTDADIALAKEYEAKLRHDVMAHVHAWGDKCPKAKGIIHLGMTSQDINDNAELELMWQAMVQIRTKMARLIVALGEQADRHKAMAALGMTHYQAAQPVTVGRRLAQYAHDLVYCLEQIENREDSTPKRGLRGATGTQASFLRLMGGDEQAVLRLERLWFYRQLGWTDEQQINEAVEEDMAAQAAGYPSTGADVFALTTQTYPRVLDCFVISDLAAVAAVLHKIGSDLRLLCSRKELDEPFETNQIGSSAMPYKRNPMRCERVCGLARFVMNLVPNAYHTAATQWLERTLDDSSNRRLVLPEAFLGLDACLNIMHNVVSGLVVHEAQVKKNLMEELPFLATENFMMEAVKLGRDRQEVHEAIRRHAMAAAQRIKEEGAANDLLERLRGEPLLDGVDLESQMDPMLYVGLSVEQTERFLREVVDPIREGMEEDGDESGEGLRV